LQLDESHDIQRQQEHVEAENGPKPANGPIGDESEVAENSEYAQETHILGQECQQNQRGRRDAGKIRHCGHGLNPPLWLGFDCAEGCQKRQPADVKKLTAAEIH
jgi:hypothetical protein